MINESEYSVRIENSTFDCQRRFDPDFIYSYQHGVEEGEASILNLQI